MALYTTMADAAGWGNIPAGEHAAVYGDGRYVCPVSAFSRWASVTLISVFADPAFPLFDAEQGNAPAASVVGAARRRVSDGLWCAIYRGRYNGDAYNGQSVDREMMMAGQVYANPALWPAPGIYSWGVDWTNTPHVRPGDLATQYGGNLADGTDLSECYGTFPVPPATPPTPAPVLIAPPVPVDVSTLEEPMLAVLFSEMSIKNDGTVTSEIYAGLNSLCWYVENPQAENDLTWVWANEAVPPVTFKVLKPVAPGYRHRAFPQFVGPDPLATANPPQ